MRVRVDGQDSLQPRTCVPAFAAAPVQPREGCESGRIGTLGKRVWGNPPWVRIPPPPLTPPSVALPSQARATLTEPGAAADRWFSSPAGIVYLLASRVALKGQRKQEEHREHDGRRIHRRQGPGPDGL